MKKDQVQIGRTYVDKVSGQRAEVRIDAVNRYGGWDATNVATRRSVRIKSAQRLRWEVPPKERRTTVVDARTPIISDGDAGFDPSRCVTTQCVGTPVMTYLNKPLCQTCWERHCEQDQPIQTNETTSDACRPIEPEETMYEEKTMSTKKTTKKGKTTKAAKTKKTTKKTKAARKPEVNPTVEIITGQPLPGEKAKKGNAKKAKTDKPKRTSALDAAAQVLAKAGTPMRSQELITAMADQGLWSSPNGQTPHATLYAAMLREINTKGKDARFKKVDRGQFEFNG
jgi:hypothetical protein